jgi:hypothetical protein
VECSFLRFHRQILFTEFPPSGIQITNNGDIVGTHKIQRSGNTYTLTGDIEGTIIIERNGVTLDGADIQYVDKEMV